MQVIIKECPELKFPELKSEQAIKCLSSIQAAGVEIQDTAGWMQIDMPQKW